jgi:hypothetical protein
MIRIDVAERLHSGAVRGLEDEQASERCFTIVFDEGPCRDNLNPFRRGPVEVGAMGAIMLGPRLQAVFSIKGVDNEKHNRPLGSLLIAPSYTGQPTFPPVISAIVAR